MDKELATTTNWKKYEYGVHCGDENCYACGTQRYNCDELNNLDNLEDEKENK